MKTIDRSHLTDLLLETLEPAPEDVTMFVKWYVGDHEKPPQGGWQGSRGSV
jgi:hypothetical protein